MFGFFGPWMFVVVMGFVTLLVFGGVRVLKFVWWRPKRIETHFGKQGIRGPPYKIFIGNVKEMVSLMVQATSHPMPLPLLSHNILPRVLSFYHHWKKLYGSTFLIWFGPTPRLIVADPSLIREVFYSKFEFFEKNGFRPLRQLEGGGLLSFQGGPEWAHRRRIIAPTFFVDNLRTMIPGIIESATRMVEEWEVSTESGDEKEVDVSQCFENLAGEVIARATFGMSCDEGKSIFNMQTEQMILTAEAFRKVFIPGYRFLPTRRNKLMKKLDKDIKQSLSELIQHRLRRLENYGGSGGGGEDQHDLLGTMIKAWDMASSCSLDNVNSGQITVEDIVEECKSFFFAGKQTASNMLTWTVVLLAMHPEWQAAARAEVIHHCGSRDSPSRDSVAKLKTMSMILNESLRLYPPAVAAIRRAKSDVMLGGVSVPAGTELLIPILAVHHDTRLWGKDASEFNPGRFSEGITRATKHPMSFLPFGLGPRTCVGQNLALLEAKIVLTIILQRFEFSLAPSYRHAPTVLLLLHPQHGAPIRFRRLGSDRCSGNQEGST